MYKNLIKKSCLYKEKLQLKTKRKELYENEKLC